jgi:outer membrane protein assembly factor BamB
MLTGLAGAATLAWKAPTWWPFVREPLALNGRVYVQTKHGVVGVINLDDGSLIRELVPPKSGVYHGLVVVGDVLYVAGSDSDVTAFSVGSGEMLWAATTIDIVVPEPGRACARPEYQLTGLQADSENLYTVSSDGHAYALSLESGEQVWSWPLARGSASSPLLEDGVLYVCSLGRDLSALDAGTGALLWKADIGEPVEWGQPVLRGETLYVSGRQGSVIAVDVANHNVAWSSRVGRCFRGSLHVEDGLVIAGDETGVHCLDSSEGELLWSVAWHADSPVLRDGVVYCLGRDGGFRLLDATTGALIEEHHIYAGHLWSRPVFANSAVLVAGKAEEGTSYLYSFDLGE